MKINKKKIELLRAKKLWTVKKLAEESGVSVRDISSREEIGAVTLGKIAKALGVEPQDICETTE